MLGKVGGLREGAVAVRALERLAAVVRPLVDRERARDGERLAAPGEVARVWFCQDGRAITYVSYIVTTK